MKINQGDVLIYKDAEMAARYGTGIVTSISVEEYLILWSGRGLVKYRRSILDGKLDEIFQRGEKETALPKERHLRLGASKVGMPFNENYDRTKVELLCEQLKKSGDRSAKEIADSLTAELFSKKLARRGPAKTVLLKLAELCSARSAASSDAQNISKELFFGYVLRKSDFKASGADK